MGRHAEGWKIRQRESGGPYYVRFTHQGERYELTTGSGDPVEASKRAAQIYADVVSGRFVKLTSASPTTPSDALFAEWLASVQTTHAETTQKLWETYVSAHFLPHFETLADFTPAKAADYVRKRLGQALRSTVKHEASALRSFFRWAKEQAYLAEVVEVPTPPKHSVGKRATTRKTEATELSPEQIEAVLAALPVWSSENHPNRFPVRAYFRVLWETGLRPITIQRLTVPDHYRRGSAELRIDRAADKSRFQRRVPLTPAACAALDSVVPPQGIIFGKHDWRYFLRPAAREVGIPLDLILTLTPYDMRHNRTTHLTEKTGNLPGVAYLVGHLQVTTTNRYAHPTARAARAVLGEVSGESRCEGGDLNPHGSYSASTSTQRDAEKRGFLADSSGLKSAENGGAPEPTGEAPPELLGLAEGRLLLASSWDAMELALEELN